MIGGDLITYRPDIQVLDATIRDGGLVNDFYFTDEFIRALYEANIKAGVDYMEFGYKASKEMFDVNKFGKWKFCNEEDIRAIVGENNTDLKISVMADVGRCDYKKDIIDRADSVIDLVRVATYINTMPAAIEMIDDAHAKGYETTCNIMAVSKDQESDIDLALEMLGKSNVDGIYIVDSYGSLYPEQIKKLAEEYVAVGEKYGKKIAEEYAGRICQVVKNYSSYVQQLAWNVMAETEKEVNEESFEEGLKALLEQNSSLFIQQTDGLTTYQLNFIRLLCKDIHSGFTTQAVSEIYPLGSKSNIDRIKKSLVDKEIITIEKEGIFLADSVFELWFKREMM